MKTRHVLLAALFLASFHEASALRVLQQVERAVELTLGDLTLPKSSTGTISFKACPSCAIDTHRVTDATVYQANRQALPLVEFLRVADELRSRPRGKDTTVAAVFLDIQSGRVTRIEINQ